MKNLCFAVMVSLASSSVFAADVDVNVGVSTDYLYRGETVTNSKPTVFGSLKFNDVVVDNAYVSVNGVLLNATPLEDANTVRSELGAGYEFPVTESLLVDVGLFRVFNPTEFESNYNEVRADAGYSFTDNFSVFARTGYKFSQDVSTDTYAGLGVSVNDVAVENLSLSVLASTARNEFDNSFEFNNVELTAEYMVLNGLYVFGTYSVGGASVRDAFDTEINFNAREIPSAGLVGLRYAF